MLIDNSEACKLAIQDAGTAFLEEAAGELEAQTKRNCKVVTGETKGSFQHMVEESNQVAYVGSNYENAIWEEFGTGLYALNGDGRKTPWVWVDKDGRRHLTKGKRPRRMLFRAFQTLSKTIKEIAAEKFGGIS